MSDKMIGYDEENWTYCVLINDEEQYSLWPLFKDVPAGWRSVGPNGTKKECLSYIEQKWTDMRPLSLRKSMEEYRNTQKQENGIAPV